MARSVLKRVVVRRGPGRKLFRADLLYECEMGGGHCQRHYYVDFGDRNYTQYFIHRDKKRRADYLKRHRLHERWNDPLTAGFWSRWLLWNKKTLEKSARDISDRLGVPIVV